MEILKNLLGFLDNVGLYVMDHMDVAVTCAIWLIVLLVLITRSSKKAVFLQQSVDDLAESNERNIDLLLDARKKTAFADEAWLAARNENLALKRENHLLKEKIQKKREFRLRDGKWCTEDQYMAELNNINQVAELQEKLAEADINDECNKQIDEFLKKEI